MAIVVHYIFVSVDYLLKSCDSSCVIMLLHARTKQTPSIPLEGIFQSIYNASVGTKKKNTIFLPNVFGMFIASKPFQKLSKIFQGAKS